MTAGGHGLDLFSSCDVVAFLDGDRPKHEFMNDDFSERLSEQTGEIHTVCIGRPFNIDYLALAQHGIHLHVYGNGFTDVSAMIVGDLMRRRASTDVGRVGEFVHLHPSLQPTGRSWPDVSRWKSQWVREFSQYDAGWSYIGAPYAWKTLADRGAIPNRLSTYVLAGLPVISDRRPGCYRYNELTRLGVNIDLVDSNYEDLRARLAIEAACPDKRSNALSSRHEYSFDASIGPLVDVLEQVRQRYLDRPAAERRRGVVNSGAPLLRLNWSDESRAATRCRRPLGRTRAAAFGLYDRVRMRRLSRRLRLTSGTWEPAPKREAGDE